MWGTRRAPSFFKRVVPVLRRFPTQPVRRLSMAASLTASPHGPLYNHSTGRWMYNEEKQLAVRSVFFDVEQLKEVACAALGVTACTHIAKVAEGSYNKVFRMQFEGGKTAIARVPSLPLLGNASMITASEVATMEFMRLHETLGIPLVYAWSKEANNPVQSPYILMEDVQGAPLLHDWYNIRGSPVKKALNVFANDVKRMAFIPFSQIGSLYFKEDLPPDYQSRPVFSPEFYSDPDILELFQPAVDRFRVGPIADRTWWRTMHDDAEADRGPWKDIGDMLLAAVQLEQRVIAKYKDDPALLQSTRTNSLQDLERVEDLLKKVAILAPSISLALSWNRYVGDGLMENVAVHADLGPNNVMVPRDDGSNTIDRFKKLTYIDWQGTAVLPRALQFEIPAVVEYNGNVIKVPDNPYDPIPWPEGMDRLSEEDQEFIRSHHRLASRECAYKDLLCHYKPFAAMHSHCLYPWIMQVLTRVLRGVADGPILLRECLINIFQTWDAEDCNGPCPISFTEEEITSHQAELAVHQQYEWCAEQVRRAMGSDIDGWVANEDYEKAQMVMQAARDQWDPVVCEGPFPLDDGKWSFFLT